MLVAIMDFQSKRKNKKNMNFIESHVSYILTMQQLCGFEQGNHIDGVWVASSDVDHGFEPRSCQTSL